MSLLLVVFLRQEITIIQHLSHFIGYIDLHCLVGGLAYGTVGGSACSVSGLVHGELTSVITGVCKLCSFINLVGVTGVAAAC